jgi:hypothetical protein
VDVLAAAYLHLAHGYMVVGHQRSFGGGPRRTRPETGCGDGPLKKVLEVTGTSKMEGAAIKQRNQPRQIHVAPYAHVAVIGEPEESVGQCGRLHRWRSYGRPNADRSRGLLVALGVLGRSDEAVKAYQRVIDDYGQDPTPALRERVARALEALQETDTA